MWTPKTGAINGQLQTGHFELGDDRQHQLVALGRLGDEWVYAEKSECVR